MSITLRSVSVNEYYYNLSVQKVGVTQQLLFTSIVC